MRAWRQQSSACLCPSLSVRRFSPPLARAAPRRRRRNGRRRQAKPARPPSTLAPGRRAGIGGRFLLGRGRDGRLHTLGRKRLCLRQGHHRRGRQRIRVLAKARAKLVLTDVTVSTTGSSSSSDDSSFYGLDAGVLAFGGATIEEKGGSVTTTGNGANAVFAYGSASSITIRASKIRAAGQYVARDHGQWWWRHQGHRPGRLDGGREQRSRGDRQGRGHDHGHRRRLQNLGP